MDKRKQKYICPFCGSTKTIVAHKDQTVESFQQELPEDMLCIYRGCHERAIKIEQFEGPIKES